MKPKKTISNPTGPNQVSRKLACTNKNYWSTKAHTIL
uniref:Uncharacterized protein n=1 Tax=Rhizophora mucronata TaxID=61149 RepID=A0A2P2QCT9_RHIMU